MESWQCVGDHLFSKEGNRFVVHHIANLGWGNQISGIFAAAQIAGMLNARLIVAADKCLMETISPLGL
jgi:hypothetical protein